jgi:pyridoxamine 5'-phosphate oxidase
MESEVPPRDAWLARDPLPAEPVPIVERWLAEAFADERLENAHAVALATVDPDGRPSVRMVLCNEIDSARGAFTMYTNRQGRKGRALAAEPRSAIAFHWPGRQVRVEGRVERTPDPVCDAYFATRPLEARLGAWASRQSEPVASRAVLLAELEAVARRFGAAEERDPVPRPPHWGGFTLVAESVELWVSRRGRIHDRAVWRRPAPGHPWEITRLQP